MYKDHVSGIRMDLKNGEIASEAEGRQGERGRDRLEEVSLRLGLRQGFPEASMVRSHGMNDNRARGSWENSKVPSPSLGLLTALYYSFQGWRGREGAETTGGC